MREMGGYIEWENTDKCIYRMITLREQEADDLINILGIFVEMTGGKEYSQMAGIRRSAGIIAGRLEKMKKEHKPICGEIWLGKI